MPNLQAGCPWSQYELGQFISCEERLCAWVRQPMNTYSNLFLFGVAIVLLAQASRDKSKTARDFGVLATLIGISSTLSHASQIRALVFLDFASQFILFAYLISLNLERIFGEKKPWISQNRLKITLILSMAFVIPSLINKRAGVPMFVILAVSFLWSEYRGYRLRPAQDYAGLKKSLGLFAVAAVCFGLDTSRIICLPTRHLFQLHAVWHVLVACSLYQLARYFSQFNTEGSSPFNAGSNSQLP